MTYQEPETRNYHGEHVEEIARLKSKLAMAMEALTVAKDKLLIAKSGYSMHPGTNVRPIAVGDLDAILTAIAAIDSDS